MCHTVIPEGEPKPATVCYQAESPDESAFVVAAKRFGFFFKARHTTGIDVEEPESIDNETVSSSTTKRFDILNILEFNSTRKRMSVICRTPEGTLVLYCKGTALGLSQIPAPCFISQPVAVVHTSRYTRP